MDGLGSLRLPQSANMGDSQVTEEALRHAALPTLLCIDIALLWIHVQFSLWPYPLAATVYFSDLFAARRQLLFTPSGATS